MCPPSHETKSSHTTGLDGGEDVKRAGWSVWETGAARENIPTVTQKRKLGEAMVAVLSCVNSSHPCPPHSTGVERQSGETHEWV